MESYIGTVATYGFNFAPRQWTLCRGQLLAVAQNTALFSLLGTFYGGDGRTTFGVPNLMGRVPVGFGQAPGTSINWNIGMMFGNDTHVMSLAEMPSHSHAAGFTPDGNATLQASVGDATSDTPEPGFVLAKTVAGPSPADQSEKIYAAASPNPIALGGVDVGTGTVQVGLAGGSQAFPIVQPSLGINYSIAVEGIFPSRN